MDKLNEFSKLAESIKILCTKITDLKKNDPDNVDEILKCVRTLMSDQIKILFDNLSEPEPVAKEGDNNISLPDVLAALPVMASSEIANNLSIQMNLTEQDKAAIADIYKSSSKPEPEQVETKQETRGRKVVYKITNEDVEIICQELVKNKGNINKVFNAISDKIKTNSHFIRDIRNKSKFKDISDKYFTLKTNTNPKYIRDSDVIPIGEETVENIKSIKNAKTIQNIHPTASDKYKYNPYAIETMDRTIEKKRAMHMRLTVDEEEYLIKIASLTEKTRDLSLIFAKVKKYDIAMNTIKKVCDGVINNIKDLSIYKEESNNGT